MRKLTSHSLRILDAKHRASRFTVDIIHSMLCDWQIMSNARHHQQPSLESKSNHGIFGFMTKILSRQVCVVKNSNRWALNKHVHWTVPTMYPYMPVEVITSQPFAFQFRCVHEVFRGLRRCTSTIALWHMCATTLCRLSAERNHFYHIPRQNSARSHTHHTSS